MNTALVLSCLGQSASTALTAPGLIPTEGLKSTNGKFEFLKTQDGYCIRRIATRTNLRCFGTVFSQAELLPDGRFFVSIGGRIVMYQSETAAGPSASLVLQSDGNLVLKNRDNYPQWASNTAQPDSQAEAELWGWADLHTHPASHIAFGARQTGQSGIFHGAPGLRLEDANASLANDLPSCQPGGHTGFIADGVESETRKGLLRQLTQLTQHTHIESGYPKFEGWPNARSLAHQQMHVSWIYRAYTGGMRVMFASATDNEALSQLWSRGTNFVAEGFGPKTGFAFSSAVRQIDFMRKFADANNCWMEIVTTPEQARAAVRNRKLAVILSVEMDNLEQHEMQQLIRDHGVRHLIPIHLVDNHFGGAATYSPVFNTLNYFFNALFFRVQGDPMLSFRFTSAQYPSINSTTWLFDGPNSVQPAEIGRPAYCALGYECCEQPLRTAACVPAGQGVKNVIGIKNMAALMGWMRQGLLLDLAHMSDRAQEELVTAAERFGYPLMNSHTGLRPDNIRGQDERGMRESLAARIATLGGMIGIGTEATPRSETLFRVDGAPLFRATLERPEYTIVTGAATHQEEFNRLTISLKTGIDELHALRRAYAILRLKSAASPIEGQIHLREGFPGGSSRVVLWDLPATVRPSDVLSFGIRAETGGGISADNWDLREIAVDTGLKESVEVLHLGRGTARNRPIFRFNSSDRRSWSAATAVAAGAIIPSVRRLIVHVWTGEDNHNSGSDSRAFVVLRNGNRIIKPLNLGEGLPSDSYRIFLFDLDTAIPLNEIVSFGIVTALSGDDWDLREIRVEAELRPAERMFKLKTPGDVFRFTGENSQTILYAPFQGRIRNQAQGLRLTIRTGGDNLDGNSTYALFNGRPLNRPLPEPFPSAPGTATVRGSIAASWEHGDVFSTVFRAEAWAPSESLTLRRTEQPTIYLTLGIVPTRSSQGADNWSIDALSLEALSDPVQTWAETYSSIRTVAKDRVAIGSDMNGLAPQAQFSELRVGYPFNLARDTYGESNNLLPLRGGCQLVPSNLNKLKSGERVFDIYDDGIAHIGMLPDFIEAVRKLPSSPGVGSLVRSAEGVIDMWERAQTRAGRIP